MTLPRKKKEKTRNLPSELISGGEGKLPVELYLNMAVCVPMGTSENMHTCNHMHRHTATVDFRHSKSKCKHIKFAAPGFRRGAVADSALKSTGHATRAPPNMTRTHT